MKNDNIGNQDFEKLLRSKMNELSDSVDCFDKISARAFPEEKQVFSESGFTISDLENITGKRRRSGIIRWTALAAAAVVCIAVIPKTGLIQRVFFDNSGSVKRSYQRLITEIRDQVEDGEYTVIDMPLQQYIENDVLITPLFSCPFEDSGDPNTSVRIYIRNIDMIPTNQVYAVEYTGSFSEENIIAAAESAYKFAGDEADFEKNDLITSLSEEDFGYYNTISDVECLFDVADGILAEQNDKLDPVSVASFAHIMYYKDAKGVRPITAEVLYGHKINSNDSYFYDIKAYSSDSTTIEIPDSTEMWKRSIYFNGNSAMPQEKQGGFERRDLFFDKGGYVQKTSCVAIAPYSGHNTAQCSEPSFSKDDIETNSIVVDMYTNTDMNDDGKFDKHVTRRISYVTPPNSLADRMTMKIYLPAKNFEQDWRDDVPFAIASAKELDSITLNTFFNDLSTVENEDAVQTLCDNTVDERRSVIRSLLIDLKAMSVSKDQVTTNDWSKSMLESYNDELSKLEDEFHELCESMDYLDSDSAEYKDRSARAELLKTQIQLLKEKISDLSSQDTNEAYAYSRKADGIYSIEISE